MLTRMVNRHSTHGAQPLGQWGLLQSTHDGVVEAIHLRREVTMA
jgi:hypothetical protein